ncbi:MAG: energy transducer TonB [Nitrospina sp.]|nr:energy transducer TonB [Nitrospina sp.]
MATTEIQKLDLLARFSKKEFFFQGSKLKHDKLSVFMLVAFTLHLSVVIFEFTSPLNTKKHLTPPPIKVKYVDIQTSTHLKQKKTPSDFSKPKTSQKKKIKPSELLAKKTHKAIVKKQAPKQRKPRKKKILKPHNVPSIIQKSKPRITRNKKKEKQQKTYQVSSLFTESKGTLAMLDGLNLEKHALQNPQVEGNEELDGDDSIPLNTKDAKYVSYFSRVKQQIQRAWIYPPQATKNPMGGELSLKFEISKDGNLLNLRLINTSGSNILDANAIKAVRGAAPYYPFPTTIPKEKLSILATFVYNKK